MNGHERPKITKGNTKETVIKLNERIRLKNKSFLPYGFRQSELLKFLK